MHSARPTLRTLRRDLKLHIPSATEPVDEIEHPILAKATEQFADDQPGKQERILAIDDEILFKVKVGRWRGAIWFNGDVPWLVAAGHREDGSGTDFYAALESDAKAARARYNAEHSRVLNSSTYVGHLLPNTDDYERHQMEAGRRLLRQLKLVTQTLTRSSLLDGREHATDFGTFRLGIQVEARDGNATYVAVRVMGSVPDNIVFLVLDLVPGCDHDAWFPETRLPDRALSSMEQAWSTIMDPQCAAGLLSDQY